MFFLNQKVLAQNYLQILIMLHAGHPWARVDGVALDKPLDSAVLSRLKQFSAMNKLKKIAIKVNNS